MKKYKIAVETGLSQIGNILKDEGYQVVDFDESGSPVDALVVTGLDDNFMGISNTLTDGLVVDASGRNAEEVLYELESHFQKKEQDGE